MIKELRIELKDTRFTMTPNLVFKRYTGADGKEHALHLNIMHRDLGRPPFDAPDFRPDPAIKPLPVIMYIAGGGFMGTDNTRKIPAMSYFLSRGYAVALTEYRVGEDGRYPRSVMDVQAAVHYLRQNSAKYALDPDRIALMGDSAGGYLALMAGYSSRGVCAVCDLFGISDFSAIADDELARFYLGLDAEANPLRKCSAASPISHITEETPATIILHGDNDPAVPDSQSRALHDELETCGVPTVYYRVHGAGHVGPEFDQTEVLSLIADFFDEHVKNAKDVPDYTV